MPEVGENVVCAGAKIRDVGERRRSFVPLEQHVTADYLADKLALSRDTVYRWCREGIIRSVMIQGSRRIPLSEVERLLNGEPQGDTNADVLPIRRAG
jgi:excisionase family DNA binding protein